MEICEYIEIIKKILKSESNYDTYRYIFKEYIQYLENILVDNPSNIKAVCQLAIMYFEDRRDTNVCIQLMEDALLKFELSMPNESLCEILNNLAFFYDVEYGDNIKADQLLRRAVELKSKFQNSYYALTYLNAESDSYYAISVMNKMPRKENLPIQYRYLFAYVLMRSALYEEALSIFVELTMCDDIEIAEKSLYNCAILYDIFGMEEKSHEIADRLYNRYKEGETKEVLTFELINLFFIQQNFERVVGLFSTEKIENIYIDVDIIRLYFYALKMTGLESECEKVYLNKVDEIKNDIDEIKSDKDFTDDDRIDYINHCEQDLEILRRNYYDIVFKNIIVEVDDIFYYSKPVEYCYLIDCPRHSL